MTLILADSGSERRFTSQRLTGGWLRVSVRGLAYGPHSGHTNLRVLLVADVLHRVVKDLHAGHVQLAVARPTTATETDDRLRLALPFTPEMFAGVEVVYLPIEEATQRQRVQERFLVRPGQTFPIMDSDLAQWRAQFEEPSAHELMGAPVPDRPADASNWAEWARRRWPTLR